MKKSILFILSSAVLLAISACNKPVEENNSQQNEDKQNEEPKVPDGAVDLGLSVYWASCNLGATIPEESGFFYAWGETATKEDYSWDTYKWTEGKVTVFPSFGGGINATATLTKYNTMGKFGKVDNLIILESIDDAAHAKLGDKWRTPTLEEWKELVDKCTWSWSIRNGIPGYQISSNAVGNTNSIFIPAAGGRSGKEAEYANTDVLCLTSSLCVDTPIGEMILHGSKDGVEFLPTQRYAGLPVRAVYGTCKLEHGDELFVDPASFDLSPEAQIIEVDILKNVDYSVSIDEAGKEWITPIGTKSLSTGKASFNIDANTSSDNRQGKITFKQDGGNLSRTVIVHQSQTNSLVIQTKEYEVSNTSQTLNIEVQANVAFDVESGADWITFVQTKSLSTSTIVLSIDANTSPEQRSGTVVVKQRDGDLSETISITQRQTDVLEVSPTEFNLGPEAQSIVIMVNHNVEYDVTVPNHSPSWISFVSDTSTKSLDENQITLSIDQNTGRGRSDWVTISQTNGSLSQIVMIYQEGVQLVTRISLDYASIGLLEGKSQVLTATVYPDDAYNKSISWKTLDNSIATVDENGKVTAVSEGRTYLYVTADDDSRVYASCTVTVYPEVVDLGLSVKWAMSNLCETGLVNSPAAYGDYYAWGETETKTYYSWPNYQWSNGSYNTLTKYNTNSSYGIVDDKTELERGPSGDDAASKILGGNWRMPTYDEWNELVKKCTWTWTTLNGVKGKKITSNQPGYTDKWIFLPAAGQWRGTSLSSVGSYCYYWTSSLYTYSPYCAYPTNIYGSSDYGHVADRCYGHSVRPVLE